MERTIGFILLVCLSGAQSSVDFPSFNDEYANCTVNGPVVKFPESFLGEIIGSSIADVFFSNLSNEITTECRFNVSEGHYFFEPISLNFSDCAYSVQIVTVDGTEFYELKYRIGITLMAEIGKVVSRSPIPSYEIVCLHNVKLDDVSGPYRPIGHQQNLLVAPEIEKFDISIWLYESSAYETQLSPPFSMTIGDTVYAKVHIESALGEFVLQATNCWSSQSSTPDTPPIYELITNGCPSIDPDGMRRVFVGYNYANESATFWFDAFRWRDAALQRAYLHCSLYVCVPELEENCTVAQTCTGRRRRDLQVEKTANQKTVTIGPIDLAPEEPGTTDSTEPIAKPSKLVKKTGVLCDAVAMGCSHNCGTTNAGKQVCVCPPFNTIDFGGKTCHHEIEFVRQNHHYDVTRGHHSPTFFLPACLFMSALLSGTILVMKIKS